MLRVREILPAASSNVFQTLSEAASCDVAGIICQAHSLPRHPMRFEPSFLTQMTSWDLCVWNGHSVMSEFCPRWRLDKHQWGRQGQILPAPSSNAL
jgi:hypothetical protein